MNVKLLRKIQKHIAAEPRRYDQWVCGVTDMHSSQRPPCGTVACIGGWAAVLSGAPADSGWLDAARNALGITPDQANRLFEYPTYENDGQYRWPNRFIDSYLKAKTPRGRASVAVRRIDHFIRTKGAE